MHGRGCWMVRVARWHCKPDIPPKTHPSFPCPCSQNAAFAIRWIHQVLRVCGPSCPSLSLLYPCPNTVCGWGRRPSLGWTRFAPEVFLPLGHMSRTSFGCPTGALPSALDRSVSPGPSTASPSSQESRGAAALVSFRCLSLAWSVPLAPRPPPLTERRHHPPWRSHCPRGRQRDPGRPWALGLRQGPMRCQCVSLPLGLPL